MAERIAYLLIPAYCSPPTTNRTGEVRLDEMGPCLGKAGLVLMAVLASSSAALAAGDPSAGQTVFASHCAVCHSTQAGVNKIAPSLAGIVGSKSGTVAGFDFSPAMKDANITWDDNNLDKFLADPPGFIRGTRMFINLPSETDRQNVIAYLSKLKK
jgi:cytochrome c